MNIFSLAENKSFTLKYSSYNLGLLNRLEERVKKLENKVGELEETMEILSDKRLLKSIKEGLDELKSGRYKLYRSVAKMKKDFNSTTHMY